MYDHLLAREPQPHRLETIRRRLRRERVVCGGEPANPANSRMYRLGCTEARAHIPTYPAHLITLVGSLACQFAHFERCPRK